MKVYIVPIARAQKKSCDRDYIPSRRIRNMGFAESKSELKTQIELENILFDPSVDLLALIIIEADCQILG